MLPRTLRVDRYMQVGLETLLQEGILELVLYVALVYKFKRFAAKTSFHDH